MKEVLQQSMRASAVLVDDEQALTCIVTSAYGNDAKSADVPLDVRRYNHSDVNFFFFTNSEAQRVKT